MPFASLSAARAEGWSTLLITCEGCRKISQRPVEAFPVETLARPPRAFAAALRCSNCGRRPIDVRLERQMPSLGGYGAPRWEKLAIR